MLTFAQLWGRPLADPHPDPCQVCLMAVTQQAVTQWADCICARHWQVCLAGAEDLKALGLVRLPALGRASLVLQIEALCQRHHSGTSVVPHVCIQTC